VVLTLVFIPFGKFFHVIQRPVSVGVEIYKRASLARDGVFPCRRCGQPLEARAFVGDLRQTMRVRSTVGQRVNSVPTTASPTQPSTFRWTWARRRAR
jgi:hypothetical protein